MTFFRANGELSQFPELSESLPFELTFYRNHNAATTVVGHSLVFKGVEPIVRRMFHQVKRLVRPGPAL